MNPVIKKTKKVTRTCILWPVYQSSLFPFRQVRVAQGHRDRLDNRGNCTKAWAKSKKEMEKTATQATNFISTIEKTTHSKGKCFFSPERR